MFEIFPLDLDHENQWKRWVGCSCWIALTLLYFHYPYILHFISYIPGSVLCFSSLYTIFMTCAIICELQEHHFQFVKYFLYKNRWLVCTHLNVWHQNSRKVGVSIIFQLYVLIKEGCNKMQILFWLHLISDD